MSCECETSNLQLANGYAGIVGDAVGHAQPRGSLVTTAALGEMRAVGGISVWRH